MKNIQFSDIGVKLTSRSGILQLVDDLGKPLPAGIPSYQLGGGNPARIPEVDAMYRSRMTEIMDNGDEFANLIGRYDAAGGRVSFIEAVATYLSKKYGWNIGPENVVVTNGSQSAFFYLFNLFSGMFTGSSGKKMRKTIVFPLVPEYIGYADQGLEPGTFVGIPAGFTVLSNHIFKYSVDFGLLEQYLEKHDDVGALCVTRPTNPTGNVLTDSEIRRLSGLAGKYQIPLFVDNAYGVPWPDIIFTENAKPYFDENIVLSMSLSKIGLPALRTGIIIARKEIATALANLNAIAALASGSMGPALAEDLIRDGTMVRVAEQSVRPFYQQKSEVAQQYIHTCFSGTNYAIHKSEGSIFLWLLMPDLSISTRELYEELKKHGVIIVPGEYFFFGNAPDRSLPPVEQHPHYTKCIRLNYSGPDDEVKQGIKIISDVYRRYSLR